MQLSKSVPARPETCQRPVMPGFTEKRRMSQASWKRSTSREGSGRGPTRLMSPLRTLMS